MARTVGLVDFGMATGVDENNAVSVAGGRILEHLSGERNSASDIIGAHKLAKLGTGAYGIIAEKRKLEENAVVAVEIDAGIGFVGLAFEASDQENSGSFGGCFKG